MGNETPEYIVEISTFFMDRYEVTNAEFDKCVQAGGCQRF
jgi:formylglycine-generating enzyme required for sulfatase activity